ncbi:asparaginase [Rubrobacter marinus]|uniref:Asparaginase n=1 Tax=Rubrobacter marinus TaxID=2653852 RepID=A0A6G8Q0T6_9ACTN|nr:asparaginase [Rubrobacter marinus]QIN80048.1 asparaginase [Rubrobacter marinus]
MTLPQIAVLSLGGTISSTRSGSGSGVTPTLTGEALVESVPEIAEAAEVSAEAFRQLPSPEITVDDLVELAAEISRRVEGGAAGVVVTQGTDTIEESSFVLDLLLDVDAPVVMTGAMRNPTLPGADGPANLLASVRVAASEAARGLGVLVVFDDEIHAARYARKTHTQSTATFKSPPVGPLGWVSEGTPRVALRPVGRHHVRVPTGSEDRPVALLAGALGDDGRLFSAVGELGYAGLVVEATGGGHMPSSTVEPLADLAARMPVVLASRTGSGEVLRRTYDFPGSEMDLISCGLIPAGPLDGRKARLLLSLLLRSGASGDEISGAFDRWLR